MLNQNQTFTDVTERSRFEVHWTRSLLLKIENFGKWFSVGSLCFHRFIEMTLTQMKDLEKGKKPFDVGVNMS